MDLNSPLSLPDGWNGVIVACSAIAALASCFFGYRLLKFWIAVAGFFVGFLLGFLSADAIAHNTIVSMITGLLVGTLLVVLSFRIYLCGVFLSCGAMAYGLFSMLLTADSWWKYGICAVLAILVGLIALRFVRPVVVISSAFSGGFSAANTVLAALSVTSTAAFIAAGLLLSIAGIVIQFLTTKK